MSALPPKADIFEVVKKNPLMTQSGHPLWRNIAFTVVTNSVGDSGGTRGLFVFVDFFPGSYRLKRDYVRRIIDYYQEIDNKYFPGKPARST